MTFIFQKIRYTKTGIHQKRTFPFDERVECLGKWASIENGIEVVEMRPFGCVQDSIRLQFFPRVPLEKLGPAVLGSDRAKTPWPCTGFNSAYNFFPAFRLKNLGRRSWAVIGRRPRGRARGSIQPTIFSPRSA